MDASLPNVRMPLIDAQGCMTSPFYRYFQNASQSIGPSTTTLQDEINTIATILGSPDGSVSDIPPIDLNAFLLKTTLVTGLDSVFVSGSLANGQVTVSLLNDNPVPPSLSFYGCTQGQRGWQTFSPNFVNASGKLDLSQPGNSNAGTLQAVTVDAFGRVTGTRAATITGTANQIDVANGDGSAGPPTLSLDAAVLNQLAALVGSPGLGYIDGLKMVWNSATSLSVTSGAAYIPSLGHVLQSPAMLTLSSLVLTASTWYHVYLYSNAGTPAIECVTTAPAAAYNGTARTKTGDTSRRYIGSVVTDASGNLYNFDVQLGKVLWRFNAATTSRVLNAGSATTATTVSLGGFVPTNSTRAVLSMFNGATNATNFIQYGWDGSAFTQFNAIAQGGTAVQDFPISPSQQMQYRYGVAPTGGAGYIDVLGYILER